MNATVQNNKVDCFHFSFELELSANASECIFKQGSATYSTVSGSVVIVEVFRIKVFFDDGGSFVDGPVRVWRQNRQLCRHAVATSAAIPAGPGADVAVVGAAVAAGRCTVRGVFQP